MLNCTMCHHSTTLPPLLKVIKYKLYLFILKSRRRHRRQIHCGFILDLDLFHTVSVVRWLERWMDVWMNGIISYNPHQFHLTKDQLIIIIITFDFIIIIIMYYMYMIIISEYSLLTFIWWSHFFSSSFLLIKWLLAII